MTVLYDYYHTAASAYNHIASTKDANRCLKKAKEDAESKQELNNNLQKFFCNDDVSDILKRLAIITKNLPGRL